jgi:hypothetical protein
MGIGEGVWILHFRGYGVAPGPFSELYDNEGLVQGPVMWNRR